MLEKSESFERRTFWDHLIHASSMAFSKARFLKYSKKVFDSEVYSLKPYQATLTFPKDYPMSPPKMRFISDICHPNVYADGKLCDFS